MASGGYESLRNAKAAFDEGLIDEQDVQIIRTAFLRAQQIKAGLDAGFIQEDEFNSVKQAFLNSLNMSSDPSALLGEFHFRKFIPSCEIRGRMERPARKYTHMMTFLRFVCMRLLFPLGHETSNSVLKEASSRMHRHIAFLKLYDAQAMIPPSS
jgi:hypothetical protein